MATGVVEGPQRTILAPHHENRLVADFERAEVARLGHIARAAHIYPVPIPDRLELPPIVERIEVVAARQRLDGCRQSGVAGVPPGRRRSGAHVRALVRWQL